MLEQNWLEKQMHLLKCKNRRMGVVWYFYRSLRQDIGIYIFMRRNGLMMILNQLQPRKLNWISINLNRQPTLTRSISYLAELISRCYTMNVLFQPWLYSKMHPTLLLYFLLLSDLHSLYIWAICCTVLYSYWDFALWMAIWLYLLCLTVKLRYVQWRYTVRACSGLVG